MGLRAFQFEEYWQTCIKCGVYFGMDKSLDVMRRRDQETFYCPNGHPQLYSKSEADHLRKQLEEKQAELDRSNQRVLIERQTRIDAENRLAREQAALKMQTKRINAGVCPHCQRTFKQLAAHMKCKHGKEPV